MDFNKLFRYEEGHLYNKVSRGNKAIVGSRSGTMTLDGYIQVGIKGKIYKTHRIIYEMLKGEIPKGLEIDHINRIRDDNRIENLRLVTRQQNQWNNNAKGYSWNKLLSKWQVRIKVNDKSKHLGLFNMEQEAREAYLVSKKIHHTITT